MILAALVEQYERLAAESTNQIPQPGWSLQKIGFVVVIEQDGTLHAIEPPPAGDRDTAQRFQLVVPGQSKPSGIGINPCFLWDNLSYCLGLAPDDRPPEWGWQRFEHFRSSHFARQAEIADPAFDAVIAFLRAWSHESLDQHQTLLADLGGFGVFRLRGASEYVHERPAISSYWQQQCQTIDPNAQVGMSLVTGKIEQLARIHEPIIKQVRGSQSSGAKLASFELAASLSYGKKQGYNAPIGKHDAFRYCTALNKLLSDRRRKVLLGDTTAVFWAARPHPIEDITGAILAGEEDEDTVRRVEAFLTALRQGSPDATIEGAATRFYVLGLAPNAARLSVRFWLDGTVAGFAERLGHHASALHLDGAPDGYAFPSIRRIVEEAAPVNQRGWPDADRVPPILAGEVARAILCGQPYPRSLFVRVIQRIRAEGFVDPDSRNGWRQAMHRRAAILKACLTAGSHRSNYEVPMSLNEDHPKGAYQLGRLFAVLEKAQGEALGDNLNASIRDRYLGAASATPSTVFPRLWRLHAHHLRKLENPGRRVNLERLVTSISARIDTIPTHLALEGQGLFFLGYYQQRQELYISKKDADAIAADA